MKVYDKKPTSRTGVREVIEALSTKTMGAELKDKPIGFVYTQHLSHGAEVGTVVCVESIALLGSGGVNADKTPDMTKLMHSDESKAGSGGAACQVTQFELVR